MHPSPRHHCSFQVIWLLSHPETSLGWTERGSTRQIGALGPNRNLGFLCVPVHIFTLPPYLERRLRWPSVHLLCLLADSAKGLKSRRLLWF